MHIDEFRDYCLAKPGTTEGLPFGPTTLVFKVMGKMYALCGLDKEEFTVNLKCEPERALELRATYPGEVLPGYHMNKKHWNTVHFEGSLSDELLTKLIDHSYELVVATLPKKLREELSGMRD